MNYTFFFDESFHDRNINFNEDSELLNIYTTGDHKIDSYVGVFFGFPTASLKEVERKVTDFEEKYKFHFNLTSEQELKSENIKSDHFQYGLRSFGKNIYRFYKEYFNLIEEIEPLIFIDTISKTEFALRSVFSNLQLPASIIIPQGEISVTVNKELFIYSLTKFFITYHTTELQKMLFDSNISENPELFKEELLKTLTIIINRNENIPRKELEIQNYQQMKQILELSSFDNIQINNFVNFSYTPNFEQFEIYLKNHKINNNDINLIIDNEENTYLAALNYNFGNVEEEDSKDCILLHLSDFLANFIGRFIYAIYNDICFTEDKILNIEDIYNNNLEDKRLISNEWFNLTKDRFLLYRKINNILYKSHSFIPYSTYGDQEITFFTLLKYFGEIKWETFVRASNEKIHPEAFNQYLIRVLSIYYKIKGDL